MTAWPHLDFPKWSETHATLHLWLQIIGKIRLAQTPWLNHSWHVTLDVTARGLATPPIAHGARAFQIDLDFIEHRLTVLGSDGASRTLALEPQPVAAFYRRLMARLEELGFPVSIHRMPSEIAHAIAFDRDEEHRSYDAEQANRFWRILLQAHRVLTEFRARFRGKSSPIQFFWGNTDLAMTRFSGRPAPEHPGERPHLPDWVLKDAYSHECSECGFWPGGQEHPEPVFYSLAYPKPPGYKEAKVRPPAAYYHDKLQEFVLPYEAVRRAPSPELVLLEFLQSTYEAAANLGGWDRAALDYAQPRFRPATSSASALNQSSVS